MGVWVIEQRAIILSATVRSPTVDIGCGNVRFAPISGLRCGSSAMEASTKFVSYLKILNTDLTLQELTTRRLMRCRNGLRSILQRSNLHVKERILNHYYNHYVKARKLTTHRGPIICSYVMRHTMQPVLPQKPIHSDITARYTCLYHANDTGFWRVWKGALLTITFV